MKSLAGTATAWGGRILGMARSTSLWMTALAMGFLAIGLSMHVGLANAIVQERAPGPLRCRISAVFGLSFFGLMPIAGLLIPGVSDLIGMRTALGVSSIIFGIGAFFVLSAAGRHVCDEPVAPPPSQPETAAVA